MSDSLSVTLPEARVYQDYLSGKYCLSCVSFSEVKGHFGVCAFKGSHAYDGSKKGRGCSSWELKPSFVGLESKREKQDASRESKRKDRRKDPILKITLRDGESAAMIVANPWMRDFIGFKIGGVMSAYRNTRSRDRYLDLKNGQKSSR